MSSRATYGWKTPGNNQNLYCIAELPDGRRIMSPSLIADPELMWKELDANRERNERIVRGIEPECREAAEQETEHDG